LVSCWFFRWFQQEISISIDKKARYFPLCNNLCKKLLPRENEILPRFSLKTATGREVLLKKENL